MNENLWFQNPCYSTALVNLEMEHQDPLKHQNTSFASYNFEIQAMTVLCLMWLGYKTVQK
jgi:hypothetical protein